MAKRKSFVIHIDSLDVLEDLSDEDAGKLFKAIKAIQSGEDLELSPLIKIAFSPFKNQFARDEEKYENTCKARAAAGSKGGKQKVANASNSKQKVANLADSDSDSKSKSKSDSKSDSKNKYKDKSIDFSILNMTDDQIAEVRRIRKANKGGSITQRVANALAKEFESAEKMGFSVDDLLTEWEVRGWKSFKAEWVKGSPMGKPVNQTSLHNLQNIDYGQPRKI